MSAPEIIKEETKADRRTPGFGQAFILFALALVLLIFIGSPLQLISFEFGLAFTLMVLIMLPALIYVRYWHRLPLAAGLRMRPIPVTTVALSMLIGMGGWSVAATIYYLQAPVLGPPMSAGVAIDSHWILASMLLVGALLPGICEEILFRGVILGVLQRKGDWFAILISGGLFGLFHIDPWRIIPAAFLGIIFGWMVVRSGSLWPAIIAHITNNMTAITIGTIFSQAERPPIAVMIGLTACFLIAGVLFYTATRKQPELPILATVPAGLPKPVAWGCGIVGALAGLFALSIMTLVVVFISIIEVGDDELIPHIRKGDQLVLMKWGGTSQLKSADTIAIRRGDKIVARVVSKVEGDRVWVREGDREIEVNRQYIEGKMIQIIKSSEPAEEERPSANEKETETEKQKP